MQTEDADCGGAWSVVERLSNSMGRESRGDGFCFISSCYFPSRVSWRSNSFIGSFIGVEPDRYPSCACLRGAPVTLATFQFYKEDCFWDTVI